MEEICINTENTMKPGEIGSGDILGHDGKTYIRISFRCIESIDMETYLNFVKECGLSHLVNRTITRMNFYRIQVLD